ncbi:class I adenylate-forming enzyme family protein [Amycolatopsis jejuensis]|uniref:class I adenylate-forming enzyme family protein n=1 Tax=Amycolatopsis jejuensis TaxID=330084 RepID=UPI0007C56D00|nr:class I adenylate-forming enzyme family protein [Amycolatopsis jejuensis]
MTELCVDHSPSGYPATTLAAAIDAQSRARPGAPFLLTDARDWTYAAVHEASDRLATTLLAAGAGRGDPIAIAAPNSAEWAVTWLAAAKIGAPVVALNVVYREREFEYMINQSGARIVICAAEHGGFDFVAMLDGLRNRLPSVREFVFLGGAGFAGSRTWDDVSAGPADQAALRRAGELIRPADPVVILYTSGTTGHPKGALLTQASILASATAQVANFGLTSDDVAMGQLPFNHVGGVTCTLTAAMLAGSAVAVIPSFHPKVAARIITERRVSVFTGVPTMYAMMLGLPEFAETDTSSVRLCVVGGANLEPALADRITGSFPGVRLANLYGLSETSGACVISAPDDDPRTLAETVGVPIGEFAVRVVDDSGAILAAGAEGELQVSGECLAAGYLALPEENDAVFRPGGWLATGDMAVIRPDGHVELRGRRKEMYVRGGYNVYPAEIENFLAGQESVAMCAVIGIPHPMFGEVGRVYVVAEPGRRVDPADLIARCRSQLADYKVPEEIVVVDELPLTPAGKIRKGVLRELAGTGHPDPIAPAIPHSTRKQD